MLSMQSYIFQSERLGFRTWQESDIPLLAELNADPEVMEFFPKIRTLEETVALVDRIKAHMAAHGYCFYAVDELASGAFIGFIGLMRPNFDCWFANYPEIGWRLRKAHWNKGYATEGAKRCLEYGFETLDFPEIYSYTALPNLRSERVMQKIGMEKVEIFEIPTLPEGHWLRTHVLYKKDRPG